MKGTYTLTEKTGYTATRTSSLRETSTFRSGHIVLVKATAVAEAETLIQKSYAHCLQVGSMSGIGDDYSDEEEMEWEKLFAQPHVQAGLDRLEEEAMRQIMAGEIAEGGFAVE